MVSSANRYTVPVASSVSADVRPTALPPSRPTTRAIGTTARPQAVDTVRPTVLAPNEAPLGADEEVLLAGLRTSSQNYIPLDVAVPRRMTGAADVVGLSRRAVFLLLHVDGVSTLAQIAQATTLPVSEVIGLFLEMLSCGAVELAPCEPPAFDPFESGVFRIVQT